MLAHQKKKNERKVEELRKQRTIFNVSKDSIIENVCSIAQERSGGRISVFQSRLPNIGKGALKIREDPSVRGTKKVCTGLFEPLRLEYPLTQAIDNHDKKVEHSNKRKEIGNWTSKSVSIVHSNTCHQEMKLLEPATPYYKLLAIELSKINAACDMFLFTGSYQDVATLCEWVRGIYV